MIACVCRRSSSDGDGLACRCVQININIPTDTVGLLQLNIFALLKHLSCVSVEYILRSVTVLPCRRHTATLCPYQEGGFQCCTSNLLHNDDPTVSNRQARLSILYKSDIPLTLIVVQKKTNTHSSVTHLMRPGQLYTPSLQSPARKTHEMQSGRFIISTATVARDIR